MSSRASGQLAGSVRWAVVPYAPRPPFRLYAGEGHAPIVVPRADTIVAAARQPGGDAELTYLVPGKARPVLILGELPAHHLREVPALRLLRLSKLSVDQQSRVRVQEDELLYYLEPDRFDLLEENAVMVSALVRVHVEAIAEGAPLGVLDGEDSRVLGERIIRYYGFDTTRLVERHLRKLLERRRSEG